MKESVRAHAERVHREAIAPAEKAREEAMSQAEEAYKKVTAPAMKVFDEATAPAQKAYAEIAKESGAKVRTKPVRVPDCTFCLHYEPGSNLPATMNCRVRSVECLVTGEKFLHKDENRRFSSFTGKPVVIWKNVRR